MDASFLNLETRTQQGHVGGVLIVDGDEAPAGWGFATVREVLEERIHLLAPYRRRVVPVPFGIDHPYWVDDAEFDLGFHLRHIAVPPPGDPMDLADLVARIHERPLDRAHPLWELYVIEGLAGGRIAIYTKVHHAAIDGLSGNELLSIVLDTLPEGRAVEPPETEWAPGGEPNALGLLGRSFGSMAVRPARAVRLGYEVMRSMPLLRAFATLPSLALGSDADAPFARPTLIAPHSALNAAISAHRRFAYGVVGLTDVKAIKDTVGVTVNDVVVAVIAGAVRRWMLRHHSLPERSLQALIPISVREPGEEGEFGNRVSAMIAPIGTHLEDPARRLSFVHETLAVAKEQHDATPAHLLQDLAEFAPPAVSARAAQLVFRNGRAGRITPFNLVISNIPGPRNPLYFAGARIEGHFPVSAIVDGAALNVTLVSYEDRLCFGLVADREIVPDLWDLMSFIDDEVEQLSEALR